MCQARVLATRDFTKYFIVECDALGNGIGVVLMQDERPISFESHPIKGKFLHKAGDGSLQRIIANRVGWIRVLG